MPWSSFEQANDSSALLGKSEDPHISRSEFLELSSGQISNHTKSDTWSGTNVGSNKTYQ